MIAITDTDVRKPMRYADTSTTAGPSPIVTISADGYVWVRMEEEHDGTCCDSIIGYGDDYAIHSDANGRRWVEPLPTKKWLKRLKDAKRAQHFAYLNDTYVPVPILQQCIYRPNLARKTPPSISGFKTRKLKEKIR